MAGIDDFCRSLALCCSCCCIGCNEASGIWCFYRSCSCRSRRGMNDTDFERAVEELYTPNKTASPGPGAHLEPASSHVLELQPRGKDAERVTSSQPAPRASMEARSREGGGDNHKDGERPERVPGEPRSERRERTREWVHAHSLSEPGTNSLIRPRSRSRSRPRSKSHADDSPSTSPQQTKAPGGSLRAPRKERSAGHGQQPSDAQAYAHAWQRSQEGREGHVERTSAESSGTRVEERPKEREESRPAPPRLEIPASLRPGRPPSAHLSAQAANGAVGKEFGFS
ncbi:hypothetical protein BV20DRAFT_964129 [Pilatotrama ljubarskyi]|nr:hypothetical protein BV20DRAFT_964129 [Pilatotrama ljubarskyi]